MAIKTETITSFNLQFVCSNKLTLQALKDAANTVICNGNSYFTGES